MAGLTIPQGRHPHQVPGGPGLELWEWASWHYGHQGAAALVLRGLGGLPQTDIPGAHSRCHPDPSGLFPRKGQFCSLTFQCGKEFTAPGACHILALQLPPAPPLPPAPRTHSHVPAESRFGSFTVLTAGALSRLLGAFCLLPLIPGECWQPEVSVYRSECRWWWSGPRVLFRRTADMGCGGGVRFWKEWWRWVLVHKSWAPL